MADFRDIKGRHGLFLLSIWRCLPRDESCHTPLSWQVRTLQLRNYALRKEIRKWIFSPRPLKKGAGLCTLMIWKKLNYWTTNWFSNNYQIADMTYLLLLWLFIYYLSHLSAKFHQRPFNNLPVETTNRQTSFHKCIIVIDLMTSFLSKPIDFFIWISKLYLYKIT